MKGCLQRARHGMWQRNSLFCILIYTDRCFIYLTQNMHAVCSCRATNGKMWFICKLALIWSSCGRRRVRCLLHLAAKLQGDKSECRSTCDRLSAAPGPTCCTSVFNTTEENLLFFLLASVVPPEHFPFKSENIWENSLRNSQRYAKASISLHRVQFRHAKREVLVWKSCVELELNLELCWHLSSIVCNCRLQPPPSSCRDGLSVPV